MRRLSLGARGRAPARPGQVRGAASARRWARLYGGASLAQRPRAARTVFGVGWVTRDVTPWAAAGGRPGDAWAATPARAPAPRRRRPPPLRPARSRRRPVGC